MVVDSTNAPALADFWAASTSPISPPADPGWEFRWVNWPDFRVPSSTSDAVAALRETHQRAASELVEICLRGGTGRTGTALALLAVLSGLPAERATMGSGALPTQGGRNTVAAPLDHQHCSGSPGQYSLRDRQPRRHGRVATRGTLSGIGWSILLTRHPKKPLRYRNIGPAKQTESKLTRCTSRRRR